MLVRSTAGAEIGTRPRYVMPPEEDCYNKAIYWYQQDCYQYDDGSIACTEWYYIGTTYQRFCKSTGGGGGSTNTSYISDTLTGPCAEAKKGADSATGLASTSVYYSVKAEIKIASADGKEHAVSFGKDANGNIISSSMNTGGTNSGTVPSIDNRFADLHNHPDPQPPSPGDMYGLIDLSQNASSYQRFVVAPDGSVYLILVLDQSKANAFKTTYPMQQIPGYPPDFPDPIFKDFDDVRSYFQFNYGDSKLIAEEKAMAFVMGKYNSGIALLKQDANGNFKRLGTKETTVSDGTKTYTTNNCP